LYFACFLYYYNPTEKIFFSSHSTVGAAYNIGIFHWRPTESAKKLAREWKDMLLADDKIWDQNGFNDIVRKQLGPSVDGDSGLVYAFDGNLKLGVLPASIFCSGHTYFVQVGLICSFNTNFNMPVNFNCVLLTDWMSYDEYQAYPEP
jgi:hypothetical protein